MKNTDEENMSTEENKAIVRQFFEEGPSKGNLDAADELLSPYFPINVPFPVSLGVKGIHEAITTCRAAFEHLNVTIKGYVTKNLVILQKMKNFTIREVNYSHHLRK